MKPVVVPLRASHVQTTASGIQSLTKLHELLRGIVGMHVQINCSALTWFDAHLSAALMTIVEHSRSYGNQLSLTNLRPSVRLILQKNRTLATRAEDSYNTTIPVSKFSLDDGVLFARYSRQHLRRKEMPRMSKSVSDKFYEGIDELFANSSLHSASEIPILSAGQFFPRHDRLSFVISDGGIGISGSLKKAGLTFDPPETAVNWAMQPHNTSRTGDIPGGLGLGILKDFIVMNGGRLLVASHNEFWELNFGGIVEASLEYPFPGTMVVMEICTSDTNSYDLAKATAPNEIW